MPKNQLTDHGKQVVADFLETAQEMYEQSQRGLERARANLQFALKVRECDHDLKFEGGIERVVTTCTKCGFSWYD